MSMSITVSDDRNDGRDEEDDDLDIDDEEDDDDRGGRSSRKNGRRGSKRKDPEDEDDADDEDDDEDEDEDEGKSEEELRAELKRLRSAVATAGKQTARQRARVKALREAVSGKAKDDDEDESDDEDEKPAKRGDRGLDAKTLQRQIDRAKKETRRELEAEHRRDLINTRAESAFTKAGVSEKSARLLMRELDLDEIDFDPKTRRIDGLDEEIDRLKDEFPDLFRRGKSTRRRINGGDERATDDRKSKPQTASQRQAAALRGR